MPLEMLGTKRQTNRYGFSCEMSDGVRVHLWFRKQAEDAAIPGSILRHIDVSRDGRLLVTIAILREAPRLEAYFSAFADDAPRQAKVSAYLGLIRNHQLTGAHSDVLNLPERWWRTLEAAAVLLLQSRMPLAPSPPRKPPSGEHPAAA